MLTVELPSLQPFKGSDTLSQCKRKTNSICKYKSSNCFSAFVSDPSFERGVFSQCLFKGRSQENPSRGSHGFRDFRGSLGLRNLQYSKRGGCFGLFREKPCTLVVQNGPCWHVGTFHFQQGENFEGCRHEVACFSYLS